MAGKTRSQDLNPHLLMLNPSLTPLYAHVSALVGKEFPQISDIAEPWIALFF